MTIRGHKIRNPFAGLFRTKKHHLLQNETPTPLQISAPTRQKRSPMPLPMLNVAPSPITEISEGRRRQSPRRQSPGRRSPIYGNLPGQEQHLYGNLPGQEQHLYGNLPGQEPVYGNLPGQEPVYGNLPGQEQHLYGNLPYQHTVTLRRSPRRRVAKRPGLSPILESSDA